MKTLYQIVKFAFETSRRLHFRSVTVSVPYT